MRNHFIENWKVLKELITNNEGWAMFIVCLSSILIPLILLPTLGLKNIADFLSLVANIVTIITGLILFSLSVIVYKRFTGSQAILDKQADACIDLIKEISGIQFISNVYDNEVLKSTLVLNVFKDLDDILETPHFVSLKSISDYQYFDSSVIGLFKRLSSNSADPFIPKKVAECILNTASKYPYFYYKGSIAIKAHGFFFTVPSEDAIHLQIIETGDWQTKGYIKGLKVNLILSDLRIIYKSTYDWLEKNNKEIFNELNIQKIV
jgi:hypothetical protein